MGLGSADPDYTYSYLLTYSFILASSPISAAAEAAADLCHTMLLAPVAPTPPNTNQRN